ncbi:MAG: PEP-CTERM sorting domain-containing protein [Verrucomicrobia bacterium]|nr:PEP-CTERM sorting domain-containing protein [Verrucomicrobiota bacterium]
MKRRICQGARLTCALLAASPLACVANISIQLDYSYDIGGFFTAPRRTLMSSVASLFESRLQDTLSSITPGGGDHWTVQFYNPSDGSLTSVIDPTINLNTVKLYLGARVMGGGTLGVGGYGGVASASGSGSFINAISGRGQSGVTGDSATATDFAPWGGSIAFNSSASWYDTADPTVTDSFPGQSDFYSVALHEVGHLMGIGTADSWLHAVNGSHQFTGANAVARYGANVPLESDDGHFAEGTMSTVDGTVTAQEAAMDPTLTLGTRKHLTSLDVAALKDIGWTVVPEPSVLYLLALGGSGVLLLKRRSSGTAR